MSRIYDVLNHVPLLESIIWNLHGSCGLCHGLRMTELLQVDLLSDRYRLCSFSHTFQLAQCAKVSRLWYSVANPELWRYYSTETSIQRLITQIHHDSVSEDFTNDISAQV